MFFWKGRTFILSAEHYTVVQKQGSRGFVRGECANGKVIKKPSEMHPKIDAKIDAEKVMKINENGSTSLPDFRYFRNDFH